MPGDYTHTNISGGANLIAATYNTDHQNHINNRLPAKIDDYSTNAAEMRTVVDPGEPGSEAFAMSFAGELARFRFILQETKGTSFWYTTPYTREDNLFAQMPVATIPQWWLQTGTTTMYMSWRVPTAYTSGDLTYQVCIRPTGASEAEIPPAGTVAVFRGTVIRYRNSAAPVTVVSAVNVNYTSTGTTAVFLKSVTVAAADFTTGDFLTLQFFRLGDDAADNYNAPLEYGGAVVGYTAIGGRA